MTIWVNEYSDSGPIPCEHPSPQSAQRFIAVSPYYRWIRVRQIYFGCHWHRPPVGMKGDQASHVWRRELVAHADGYFTFTPFELVPR